MYSRLSTAAAALAILNYVEAVDIHGQAQGICATGTPTVAICDNIPSSTCCVFPAGGIIAKGAYFSVIQDCGLGVWYKRSVADPQCAQVREFRQGFEQYACLSGGSPSDVAGGGGAAWFGLSPRVPCSRRRSVEASAAAENALVSGALKCTSTKQATVLAFEGQGAWVLEPGSANWEAYSQLPATENMDEHLANMKKYGQWYEHYDNHVASRAAMKKREF